MSAVTYDRPELSATSTRRAVLNTLKGSSGNLVEWYDVYVYTVFATYFEPTFFGGDEPNATVYTMAIFAVTFVMRPVGSWFFGRYADRRGRRPALVFSVSLMALASTVIALTPTHDAIGGLAIVLLVLCRLVQGFATGGEYGTSATYMSEAATRERRGFFSSFQYVTLVGGHALAQLTLLILQVFLDDQQMSSFGWRIAFALGGLAAVTVFWLRSTMDESLSKEALESVDRQSGSLRTLLTTYPKALLICFLVTMGGTIAFYVYSVNGPATVKAAYKGQGLTSSWVNLSALILLMALQPIGGLISDKIGRKPLLIYFGVCALVWTYVVVTYLPKIHTPMASFGMLAISYVILTGYTSINAIVKAELFPARVRALGVGVGYALANSAFGGTAPVIYEAAKKGGHVTGFIGYVTACVAASLLVYIFVLKNKRETILDREQGRAYATSAG
ncbi:MFS transporter [Calidifontibacter sp. DB0510]|uniref:Alpha-ketoglutarate permease n=1 Tax=Metallococcus carri TaxID=1656884 RepID=A0A967B1U7_9MICO|nr:MFS transporter [Metallococcus carri]NHN56753.1 MFS transporter [Metallococcus carri]NOP37870.1 MFS transporter [Calidifontibacter sp. DB2511S]